ncbi:EXS_family protein [Hexamita inflata]|uniref:EXS family protein n=1 Tax=Hexamita inflata TaxID=28002 RepID=A0AA86UK79_9EUKA|nr:EXS family protein [Hexamita inflata]
METPDDSENEELKVRTSAISSFIAGTSAILVIQLISLTAYYFDKPVIKFKLTAIQQMAIRIHFIIVTIILGIGINVYLFYKKKINFAFICQIPGDIVNLMHRNVLKIGYIQLTIVTRTTILVIVGQIPIPSPPPLLFGQFVLKVSNIMKPTYWLLFPTLSLPLFTLVNVVRNWDKRSIFTYCLITLFKMFTPWRQRIEFPHFFWCSMMMSAKGSFKEIILIITCNKMPDYIAIIFENVFHINRVIQSGIRWKEMKKFYNQGAGMMINMLGILTSMINVAKVKGNYYAYWTLTAFRALQTCIGLYWTVCEDWTLFYGGYSGGKYRHDKKNWTYGCQVRRPTHLKLWLILAINLYDYIAKCIWIVPYFKETAPDTSTFWYKLLMSVIEMVRFFLWMLMRMDNQQATNAEDYSKTKFIPVVIDSYERSKANQEQQQKESKLSLFQSLLTHMSTKKRPKRRTQANHTKLLRAFKIYNPFSTTKQAKLRF